MKRKVFFVAMWLFAGLIGNSQTVVTFENLPLPDTGFWNGSDLSGGFSAQNAFFVNYYDTTYGSWSGFAYSNHNDTVTAGYLNQYSAIAGSGVDSSDVFALCYVSPWNAGNYIKFNNVGEQGVTVNGFYVTNNTYAYISMRDGDAYAKKFGGDDGNDPDWFKLTITGYKAGDLTGSVDFYLADYRFDDNSLDYIIKDWTWVDLTSLGSIDSIAFSLSSSDTGQYGMNTPAYFCVDNLTYTGETSVISTMAINPIKIYPNPATNFIMFNKKVDEINIYNVSGKNILKLNNIDYVNIKNLPKGIYLVKIKSENRIVIKKIVKK